VVNDVPPTIAPLEIEVAPSYVVGFPALVAISLRCSRPCETSVPHVDLFTATTALGVTLLDASGAIVVETKAPKTLDPEFFTLVALHAGETRRALVDVSSAFGSTPAGRYRLTVCCATFLGIASSAPAEIELRAPTPDETRMLDDLSPRKVADRSWSEWALVPPDRDVPWRSPIAVFHDAGPLRLHVALRSLIFGDDPVLWEHATLEHVGAPCAPEIEAIWAEILALRVDAPLLGPQLARIRSSHPSLGWWVDAIESGRGPIAELRASYAPLARDDEG
jgi:hypothetical protein